MEVDQVVYEYGKLHLNFVGCQRQATLLATQLAQANKTVAALTDDKGKVLARVAQLEEFVRENNLSVPAVPDPPVAKEPTPGPALVPPAKTDN